MLKIVKSLPELPYYAIIAPCGFPSPADDHLEERINLDEYVVKRPSSSFVMRVSGNSMNRAGIVDGDMIIVDKSEKPLSGKIVVAVLNGDMTVKYLQRTSVGYILKAANPKYPSITLSEDNPPEIWGVVVGVVRRCE